LAAHATGEGETGPLRLDSDRSVKLVFSGSSISSDGGLLLHRELDDALGLTGLAADRLADPRTGKNGRHHLAALLRQSIFSRLAGYEDVNDADRLCRDPVMRQLVGGRAVEHDAASAAFFAGGGRGVTGSHQNHALSCVRRSGVSIAASAATIRHAARGASWLDRPASRGHSQWSVCKRGITVDGEAMTMGEENTSLAARVAREKEAYEQGLQRGWYNKAVGTGYTEHLYKKHRYGIVERRLRAEPPKKALEIGASAWRNFFEGTGVIPQETHCINISEVELSKGREAAVGSRSTPIFHLMDAHNLEFEDDYFDFVYGGAILHHLDLPIAYTEIARVLKPNGLMIFAEPLDTNPVAKLVRWLTPKARTPDERAFRHVDIELTRRRFDCELEFEQFLTVPFGLIARRLFKNPDNSLMRSAFRFDEWLKNAAPAVGPYYRRVLVVAHNRPPRNRP
jgi:SAM-dependent methyltransferase